MIQFGPVLLIIVGAGGSYDSDWRRSPKKEAETHAAMRQFEGYEYRPPLAKDLFDERFGRHVARYPPSQGLMVRLRRASPAVEEELERIRSEAKTQEHLPRQLIATRYYLRELIGQTVEEWVKAKPDRLTNFTRLLIGLEPWRQQAHERIAIVTFNYDTLFDEALENFLPRFQLRQIGDYIGDTRYQLFKLHGSVNWWREVQSEWISDVRSISPDWASTMFDPPGPFTEDGLFHVFAGAYPPCVPCLAIPTATKGDSDFVCPQEHLDQLKQQLNEVTNVLIVGWKGIERHFLEMWRLVHATKKDPSVRSISIVDISVSAGQEIAARVTHHIGLTPKRDRYYETFSTFVNEKLDEYLTVLS